jgi:hypothetical protein
MQKIKLFIESEKGKDIMIIIIVVLVGISSFYLGRLSHETSTNGVKIEYTSQEASAIGSTKTNIEQISLNPSISEKINNNVRGSYFASKKGKKYYPIGCSAGKSIKKENRIYFNTANEAENAGFSLSRSC